MCNGCIQAYLGCEHAEIRREAVVTCCRLLEAPVARLASVKIKQTLLPTIILVHKILEQVLIVGINDPGEKDFSIHSGIYFNFK